MALSVAGIMTNDPVIIKDTECIKKSYPDFYPDMTKIGVKIS